ncbi:undecaprenyl/decaprenyl-phosphate alpha-N-acetylglucosaminyl 1-phosphate transferase [Patescibacteria group bacterium]|nr:undecaprenyl/decaprenyl-phosphate alpha-N-acetylglucosaminyl 1-phosphate transferase [Patescibacteria group bacterium]
MLDRFPHLPELGILFLAGFFLTGGLTYLFYRLARAYQLLPVIRPRDVHTTRKPRVGGLAMWLAVVMLFILAYLIGHDSLLNFGRPQLGGVDTALWAILAGMGIILIVGLIDDVKSLTWPYQLAGQLACAVALVAGGVTVPYLRVPFYHVISLDHAAIHLPAGGQVSLWGAVFTIIWTILMINVMNFFDGLDGLAGSVALTAAIVLFFVSMRIGFTAAVTLSVAVAGVAAGFLPWNWYPSKLFMGTVGSQLLGFLLAVIAIISGGKVATAVLVLGIPVFDAGIVIVRRLMAHQSPFKADQRHLHHRLLKIGIATPWVVVIINVVAVVFGVLAIGSEQTSQKGELTILLAGCMAVFIAITYWLEHRKSILNSQDKRG